MRKFEQPLTQARVSKKLSITLALVISVGCALLFNSFYEEAQHFALKKLNEEQLIHARQAARGIDDFFGTWRSNLNALAVTEEFIDTPPVARHYMQRLYETHQEHVKAITRVNEKGVVVYNVPSTLPAGTDLSYQRHVREMLQNHRTVVSDVFEAAEGGQAVALHVPVFKGAEFKGSIAILIDFRSLAHRYLEVIRVGTSGYAWVISREGTILYTPQTNWIGKPVREVSREYPLLDAMVSDMLKGKEGAAEYEIKDENLLHVSKYAVFMPVPIENTFWSIAVATTDEDALSGLVSFRNRLIFLFTALFVCGVVFSTLGARAWLIVKEEKKRRLAEMRLRESEERFRKAAESVGAVIWEIDPDGLITYASPFAESVTGYAPGELVRKMHFYDLFEPSAREEMKVAAFQIFAERQTFRDLPGSLVSKSGRIVHLEASGSPMFDASGNFRGYLGAYTDVTGQKQMLRELEQQRGELAHLSRVTMLNELSGSLSHELNQPLMAILGNAQAALRFMAFEQPDLDELREILQDIVNDDKRAGEVIKGLRRLLRKEPMRRESFDVNDLVQDVLRLVRSDIGNAGASISVQLELTLPNIGSPFSFHFGNDLHSLCRRMERNVIFGFMVEYAMRRVTHGRPPARL